MLRVLAPRRCAVIVVGPSTIRGIEVATERGLADLAVAEGFECVGIAQRLIDRDKRMMPARHGVSSGTGIELRMHKEFVIGLFRPASMAWSTCTSRL
jgi:hypothetical protein